MAFHFQKRISLFASTVALATLVPSIAFAAPAKTGKMSQPNSIPSASTTQGSSQSQRLKLNSKQQQQIKALLADRQREIEAVLTKDQRPRFEQAMRSEQKLYPTLQSLNLTANQKNRVHSIVQAYNQKLKGVMTAQQLQPSQNQKSQMHQ
jgi:hypothetical protein